MSAELEVGWRRVPCSRCGAELDCGVVAGATSCWCAELPVLKSLPGDAAGCLCRVCLQALLDGERTVDGLGG